MIRFRPIYMVPVVLAAISACSPTQPYADNLQACNLVIGQYNLVGAEVEKISGKGDLSSSSDRKHHAAATSALDDLDATIDQALDIVDDHNIRTELENLNSADPVSDLDGDVLFSKMESLSATCSAAGVDLALHRNSK